ncbi:MAG: hypothetical protein RDV41_03830 [Planctomycetota bacterium]|nr:hypothetical protein [Planctomycetota bacterium]
MAHKWASIAAVIALALCGCKTSTVRETFCTKLEDVSVKVSLARTDATLDLECSINGCHLGKVALHDPFGATTPMRNMRTVATQSERSGFSFGFGVGNWHDDFGTATGITFGSPPDSRYSQVSTRGSFDLPSARVDLNDWALTCSLILPSGEEMAMLFILPPSQLPTPAGSGEGQAATVVRAEGAPADRVRELQRRKAVLEQSLNRNPLVPKRESILDQIKLIEGRLISGDAR